MKKIVAAFLLLLSIPFAVAQLTQPPGGITSNLPYWVGGNGSSGQVLTSRGVLLAPTFQASSGGASGANPTGTVGTAAVNGVAATFLRSDGAPAINLAMTPTWTGTHSWTGNSVTITAAGVVTAGQFGVNQTSLPLVGIYRPAAGTLGFACNSAVCGIWSQTLASMPIPISSTGTKFTAAGTGCTVGTTTGGAYAGTFALAAGPCTSVALTIAGATGATSVNGWSCQAHDRTAPTVLIGGEASSTTTTATITIPAGAGATDVISFSCVGF